MKQIIVTGNGSSTTFHFGEFDHSCTFNWCLSEKEVIPLHKWLSSHYSKAPVRKHYICPNCHESCRVVNGKVAWHMWDLHNCDGSGKRPLVRKSVTKTKK